RIELVLVSDLAQCRGAEIEGLAFARIEPTPASAQHAQEMTARKDKRVVPESAKSGDHTIGSGAGIRNVFTPGAAVAKKLPVGPLAANLGCCFSVVFAVIPFDQVRVDDRLCSESGQLAGPARTLKRTCEDMRKLQSGQTCAELARVALAAFGEGDIGQPGVLA